MSESYVRGSFANATNATSKTPGVRSRRENTWHGEVVDHSILQSLLFEPKLEQVTTADKPTSRRYRFHMAFSAIGGRARAKQRCSAGFSQLRGFMHLPRGLRTMLQAIVENAARRALLDERVVTCGGNGRTHEFPIFCGIS